uniref:Uncharacterized protein n=1 Tax=viral metagenome TaxID=1070528 RepID=A0A6C0JBP1_9ZZZZ
MFNLIGKILVILALLLLIRWGMMEYKTFWERSTFFPKKNNTNQLNKPNNGQ